MIRYGDDTAIMAGSEAHLKSITAVSYTHLDVYKRQILYVPIERYKG